jgi:DNA-binding winged helix-turn-helix (wHTH) protein/tetratricopeptide (TPR) repeat protein
MAQPGPSAYRFGPFCLDVARGSFHKGTRRVRADARLIRCLLMLIEHRDQIVSRAFPQKHLWPDGGRSGNGNLDVLVCQVRRLLRDDSRNPRFICTHHGEGCRFIFPVEVVSGSAVQSKARSRTVAICHRAWQQWAIRTPAAIRESIRLYTEALEQDPTFSIAWSGRPDAWIMAGVHCLFAPTEAFLRARSDAKQAMRLDANGAEFIVTTAWVKLCFDWDLEGARRDFERAITLNREYPFAHNGVALLQIAKGQPTKAIEAMEKAWTEQAASPFLNALLGDRYYQARQYDEAARRARVAFLNAPHFAVAHAWGGRILLQQRKFTEAVSHFERTYEKSPGSDVMVGFLAHAYGVSRNPKTEEIPHGLEQRRQKAEYVPAYFVALAKLGLGLKREAVSEMKTAIKERSHWVLFLKTNPAFDSLRGQRQFEDLSAEIGGCPPNVRKPVINDGRRGISRPKTHLTVG